MSPATGDDPGERCDRPPERSTLVRADEREQPRGVHRSGRRVLVAEVGEGVGAGCEQPPEPGRDRRELPLRVRRLAEAEVPKRRIRLPSFTRTAGRTSTPSQLSCRRSSATRRSVEPRRSASRPSSRGDSTTNRTGPSRSPSRRTRSSKVATSRSALGGALTANVNPSGTADAQRANCSSDGSRYPVELSSTVGSRAA